MMTPDGTVHMLDATDHDAARAEFLRKVDELELRRALLVEGTEPEIRAMARQVKLGHDELDRRAKRRRAQRASRRQNR